MAFCFDAARGKNGIYELPAAVTDMRVGVLWHWVWPVWKAGALRTVLRRTGSVDVRDHPESPLDAQFRFRSIRVALAELNLLEKTTVFKETKPEQFLAFHVERRKLTRENSYPLGKGV